MGREPSDMKAAQADHGTTRGASCHPSGRRRRFKCDASRRRRVDIDPQPVPKSVLVVDDLPEIGQLMRATLSRLRTAPLEITTEINSKRAIDLLATRKFDLVISDFRMREANGFQVLAAAVASNPDGHRVLMTGYQDIPATRADIDAAKVDAYIQKPLRTQDVLLLALGFLQKDEGAIREHREAARRLETGAGA